jgi:hypothetical protein
MSVNYDYFVASDGLPGNDVVDTRWVDPTVRLGQLYARLTDQCWMPRLVRTTRTSPLPSHGDGAWYLRPSIEKVADDVRDALAAVVDEQVPELGEWWAGTEEFRRDQVPAAEATALLAALVRLCDEGRQRDQHLYVLSGL